MAATSPRDVNSGYFRVHSYVLLGLSVLAAAVAGLSGGRLPLWPPIAAAALSYIASVIWLYEKPRAGRLALLLVAAVALLGTWVGNWQLPAPTDAAALLYWLAPPSGGFLLGVTLAAMLLGHWYLNQPQMKLAPLQRLVQWMGAALVVRAALCAAGMAIAAASGGTWEFTTWLFLALRWLAGIMLAALMAWMTWQTLKIPNTQSATGILYVALILVFVGELASQLATTRLPAPV